MREGERRRCVAGARIPLLIEKAKHVRIQDLVVRGGSKATIALDGAKDVELDGVTAFGGSPALMMDSSTVLVVAPSP